MAICWAKPSPSECYGITAIGQDLAEVTESDRLRVNGFVLLAILAILLVLVRRVWLAAYLLVTVLASYYAALGATTLAGVLLDRAHADAGRLAGAVLPVHHPGRGRRGLQYFADVARAMEERKKYGPVEGMRRALAKTGGAITSCGLIMAGTFATLMLAGLNTLMQIGFALAFGVLVDTFIVRPFLVPAAAIFFWGGQREPASAKAQADVPRVRRGVILPNRTKRSVAPEIQRRAELRKEPGSAPRRRTAPSTPPQTTLHSRDATLTSRKPNRTVANIPARKGSNMRCAACVAFLAMVVPLRGGNASDTTNSFKLSVNSKSVLEFNDTKKEIIAKTEMQYSWTRKGEDRTLAFELVKVQTAEDGQETLQATMNRKKIVSVVKGEAKETPFDDATPAQQAMLKDGFESPICILRVDKAGKELKRTIVAGAGAKAFIDNGQIANALMFHPPFFKDQEKWDAQAEFPLGNGGFARGTLSSQKKAADKQKMVVQVAGVLASKTMKKFKDITLVEEWRHDVKGEQEYDLARQEWTAGKLAIDVKMDVTPDNGSPVKAKGTIDVAFTRLSK